MDNEPQPATLQTVPFAKTGASTVIDVTAIELNFDGVGGATAVKAVSGVKASN